VPLLLACAVRRHGGGRLDPDCGRRDGRRQWDDGVGSERVGPQHPGVHASEYRGPQRYLLAQGRDDGLHQRWRQVARDGHWRQVLQVHRLA